jgi:hydrogenase nickel incorporation protein HypA/HybF
MHDLTYAKEIMDAIARKSLELKPGSKIKAVHASISPLSHVTPERLKETFSSIAKDTPFKSVRLEIETLELGVKCESCKRGFMINKPTFECPECRSSNLNIVYSKEFRIDSIETVNKRPAKA